jgi:hypothetical protein
VLPPLDAADHLAEILFKVGPSTAGEVISYQEIKAWSDLSGYTLNGWESETLRSLSGEYLAEIHAAEEVARPAPYQPAERIVSREEVSNRLLAAFTQLGGKVV